MLGCTSPTKRAKATASGGSLILSKSAETGARVGVHSNSAWATVGFFSCTNPLPWDWWGFFQPSVGNSETSTAIWLLARVLTSLTLFPSDCQVAVSVEVLRIMPRYRQNPSGNRSGNLSGTTSTVTRPDTPWIPMGTSALSKVVVGPPMPTARTVLVGTSLGFSPCKARRSHSCW
jgi:hypothetical protein